ncbi:MAG: hypothetical protein ACFFE8_15205 [Candidatus Heimdallarchaeota archaeon]
MFGISFISTGTTATQTPVFASIGYEMIKYTIKEKEDARPDFPIACIFDFSSMYSTLQFFASDKILMRMGELTSLTEEMSASSEPDWSKCSFPSKFAHKDTKSPLFFIIPLFPRGTTTMLTKSDVVGLNKLIWEISKLIEKEGCQYLLYDLPPLEVTQRVQSNSFIPALLNSNLVIGVIDCNKPKYTEVAQEIRTLQDFLPKLDVVARPGLKLNGLILNQVSEKVLYDRWFDQIEEEYAIPILGKISEDPQFSKISSQFQLPTIDSLFNQMKCAKDFQSAAEAIIHALDESANIREVNERQQQYLESNIINL